MSVIRITASGLSGWELNFLQATVGIASGADIAQWCYEPDAGRADVVLAASDTREGAAWLERGRNGDGASHPLVIELRERSDIPGAAAPLALGRPIRYGELVGMLREIEGRRCNAGRSPAVSQPEPTPEPAAAAEVAVAPAVAEPLPPPGIPDSSPTLPPAPALVLATAEPEPEPVIDFTATDAYLTECLTDTVIVLARKGRRAARFFDDTRLLGLLRRAIDSGQATEIRHARFPTLTVYPTVQAYEATGDAFATSDMFRVPAREFACRVFPITPADELRLKQVLLPLSRLLYGAALHGSEGRLRADAEPDDILEFLDGPEFVSMPLTLEQQSIVLKLAGEPCNLQDLVERTAAPLDTIIDLVNAFDVLGCIHRTRIDASGPRLTHRLAPAVLRQATTALPPATDNVSTGAFRRLQSMLRSVLQRDRPDDKLAVDPPAAPRR